MKERKDQVSAAKAIVALRTARAALGWTQEQIAKNLGICKTTLARFETMEGNLKQSQLLAILSLCYECGVTVDFMEANEVTVKMNESGITYALGRLQDESLRRSDRHKPKKELA